VAIADDEGFDVGFKAHCIGGVERWKINCNRCIDITGCMISFSLCTATSIARIIARRISYCFTTLVII